MNKHEININVSNHVFDGLSKQGLLAAQATCELVDNAIAAAGSKGVARVQIIMEDRDDLVNLYVMDWGCGMDLPALEKAMQLGSTPDSDSRLNEHGFGIKNSLSSLSGGKRDRVGPHRRCILSTSLVGASGIHRNVIICYNVL